MKKYYVPQGRIKDYNHPHPDRTAVKYGKLFEDVCCIVYPSREFMKNALKKQRDGICNPGNQFALIKDIVPINMLLCPFYEKGE